MPPLPEARDQPLKPSTPTIERQLALYRRIVAVAAAGRELARARAACRTDTSKVAQTLGKRLARAERAVCAVAEALVEGGLASETPLYRIVFDADPTPGAIHDPEMLALVQRPPDLHADAWPLGSPLQWRTYLRAKGWQQGPTEPHYSVWRHARGATVTVPESLDPFDANCLLKPLAEFEEREWPDVLRDVKNG